MSLDPETLPQVSDAETEFSAFSENFGDASDYAQTEKTRALGAIAEPGKFVSFYIGLHGLRDAEGGLHPLLQPSPETSDQRIPSIQLGCAPSRIDDMPSQLNEAEDMSGVLVADNFTAMSESGLFIRLKAQNGETGGEEVLKACKVDIPMAQITATDLP